MAFKIFALTGALLAFGSLAAQERLETQSEHQRENTEWTTSYSYNAVDRSRPRVLLVGDSICNAYKDATRDSLAGTANVTFLATSKCVCDKTYLRQLAFFLEEYDYAVVHFNNGLHSLNSNQQDWENSLRAAIRLIKEKGKGAKIIWCSSTPLKDSAKTETVKKLNAIAARVMAEEGVPIDDLFALADPFDREENWRDNFHFKNEAVKMQGEAVAACVRNALGLDKAGANAANAALKAASSETGPDGKIELGK